MAIVSAMAMAMSSVEAAAVAPVTKTTKEDTDGEDDGVVGVVVDRSSSSSCSGGTSSSPLQPPTIRSPAVVVDVNVKTEGREEEGGGDATTEGGGASEEKKGDEEGDDDDSEEVITVASCTDGRRSHTHEQLREFCSRPDLHPIRFGASNVARMAGLNPYADLPELLMRLVYQSPLGQSLLRRDAELLGLQIRSEEEELIELAEKVGGGTLANVKRALAIQRGEEAELPDTVHAASILKDKIRNEALKSRRLSKEEMRVLTDGTRQAVDTGFGTGHEDVGLDLYERRVGWEVRERNSAVMEWSFVRAEDEDEDECEGNGCDEVGGGDGGDDLCEGGDHHRGNGGDGADSSASGEANSTLADDSPAVGSDASGGIRETGDAAEAVGAMSMSMRSHAPLPTVMPMGPATRRVRDRKRPRTPKPSAPCAGSSSDEDDNGGKMTSNGCDAVRRLGRKRRRCDRSLDDPDPDRGDEGKEDREGDNDGGHGPGMSGSDEEGVDQRGRRPLSTKAEEKATSSVAEVDTRSSPSPDDEEASSSLSSTDLRCSSDVCDSTVTASRPVEANCRRNGRRQRRRPFFTIMGSVDGIRDELCFDPRRKKEYGPGEEKKESEAAITRQPSTSALSSSPSSNVGGTAATVADEDKDEEEVDDDDREDDDGWTLRPVVVECKHRMRSSSVGAGAVMPPPPLYDQVQACCYCLMYGTDRADIVQVVRRPPRRRGSEQPPLEDDENRKHGSTSSVGRVDVVTAPPSTARDRDGDDGSDSSPKGDEDGSSGAGGGADGRATTATPNYRPATAPDVDVDITVSRVGLDDPLHRHRENWHRVVLPRLRSFVEAAYAIRGDDDRRYRLLAAMCDAGAGAVEDGGGTGVDEEKAWRILLDECGWLADCDTVYGRSRA